MTRFLLIIITLTTILPVYGITAVAAESYAAKQTITVGIFPRRDPAITIKLFTPLIEYLEQQLKRPIRLETAANFKAFNRRLQQRRYDLVHLNQYQYIQAHKESGYETIIQNEEFNDKTIRGAIYIHQDSGINSIAELKGRKILFGGGPTAMMSYIVPTYLLRQEGLARGDYQEVFAVSPPNAVLAVYLKQIDAAGAGEMVYRLPLITRKIDTRKLRLLKVSDPLPHLPWAVKQEMEPQLKQKIQQLMLALNDSESGKKILKQARLTGFSSADDSSYDHHRQIIDYISQP